MAQAVWELRAGGLGNLFLAREARSLHTQALYHLVEVQARVAAEVTASAKMVRVREAQWQGAQRGVREAAEMWRRLDDASFGVATEAAKFDPIQPFLAVRALRDARLAYLREVLEYNRQQFRLYWALGQPPIHALDKAAALPVSLPVLPPAELPGGKRDK
jgi:hypothetical protein